MTDASGCSLWLVPDGLVTEHLTAIIVRLSERFGTPVFEPHVTLLGEVVGPEPEIIAGVKGIADRLEPFPITLEGIDGQPVYFRCLYLRANPSAELMSANQLARRQFQRLHDARFDPHLSLLYGDLNQTDKESARTLIGSPGPISFLADSIELVRTSGGPSEWTHLATIKLSGNA